MTISSQSDCVLQNVDEVKKFEGIVRNLLKSQKIFESGNQPTDGVSLFQQTFDVKEKRWIDHPTTFDALFNVVFSLVIDVTTHILSR